MKENKVNQIKDLAVKGTMTLTIRRIILRAIDMVGMIFLARLLTQSEFGIFGIINFIVFTLFGFLSDIGLAASLIQKKEKIKKDDTATVFSVQLILVLLLNVLVWLFSPLLVQWYHLSFSSIWLMRVTALCLIVTSFKTIPSVLLEKNLLYEKLLIPQIFEHLSYSLVAVGLALMGYGVWSLIIAMVVRTVLGAVVLNFVNPWRIKFLISKKSLKNLLTFGVPYQLNSFLALLKDNLTPTVIAFFYGPAAVGYVNLAQGIASKPMEITNVVNRVVFPTFSKIQGNKERIGIWIEKGIRLMAYIYLPLVFGLLITARPILTLVYANKSDKWLPALAALYPFIIGALPVVMTTTITNVLFALGKSKTVLKLMGIYTLITWVLGIPLIIKIGYSGIAWAGVAVSLVSVILTWREIKKAGISFSIRRVLGAPFLAAGSMALLMVWPIKHFAVNIGSLIGLMILAAIVYIALLFLFLGSKMKKEYQMFLSLIPGKSPKTATRH